MLDHITTRRIAAAMEHLDEAGRRSVARARLLLPVVGSRMDRDEFGLSILRPVRADEAAQEQVETLERFAAAARRLSGSQDADTAEPVAVAVAVPVAATCKLVPSNSEIGSEL